MSGDMGTRLLRGVMVFALLAAPFLLGAIVDRVLQWHAIPAATQILGSGAEPAAVARLAATLAAAQMNRWIGNFAGQVLLVWFAGALYFGWTQVRAPLPRRNRIRTPRLTLRRAREADLHAFHALFADAETLRYWDRPPHQTLDETATWLNAMLTRTDDGGDSFVIERAGRVIGAIGIRHWPWLWFVLDRGEWRQGYAAEAMQAFLRYIFGRGLELVTSATDARNAASLVLLRKCGFLAYQQGEGRHPQKDEAYPFVSLRCDRPRQNKWLHRLMRRPALPQAEAPLWGIQPTT